MTLYLIGIGLRDEKDITVRGLETLKSCSRVYLEHYTSILTCTPEKLSEFYGKEVLIADRNLVETQAEEKLLLPAKDEDVAMLIVGDVFSATTHTDLQLRAKELGVKLVSIHNTSILTAIGVTGLELYKYGKTTSIVFPQGSWLPHTPYDVIKGNQSLGLHTLCLLDIKVAEPSIEDLRRGINKPQPPRFMRVGQALDALLMIEKERSEGIITKETLVVGLARIGHDDFVVKAGTVKELMAFDFGKPLHSLIVPGKLHDVEKEMLDSWK